MAVQKKTNSTVIKQLIVISLSIRANPLLDTKKVEQRNVCLAHSQAPGTAGLGEDWGPPHGRSHSGGKLICHQPRRTEGGGSCWTGPYKLSTPIIPFHRRGNWGFTRLWGKVAVTTSEQQDLTVTLTSRLSRRSCSQTSPWSLMMVKKILLILICLSK